jgi:hypothetical protein
MTAVLASALQNLSLCEWAHAGSACEAAAAADYELDRKAKLKDFRADS